MAPEYTTAILALMLFACVALTWCTYTLHDIHQTLTALTVRPDTGTINRGILRELTSLVLEVQDELAETKQEASLARETVEDVGEAVRGTRVEVGSLQGRLAKLVDNVAGVKMVLSAQRPERVVAADDGSAWVVYRHPETERSPYLR